MNDKDNLSKNLGFYLKYLRKKHGLSLEEISTKSLLSVSYISRLENGLINSPSLYTVEALAKAYNISVYELLNLEIDSDNNSILSLEELIIKSDFTYNNIIVDINTKQAILNLINSLIEINMDDNIDDIVNICNLLSKYTKERKIKEHS